MSAVTLSQRYLLSILSYDPLTGELKWKRRSDVPNSWNARYEGQPSSTIVRGRGPAYYAIRINGIRYYAHRLAFVMMVGREPLDVIDHIDGNGLNNTWTNLREATQSQNHANSKPRARLYGGRKGAYFDKERGGWNSSITVNGRTIYLGRYKTWEEAHEAYRRKAHEVFGEFVKVA